MPLKYEGNYIRVWAPGKTLGENDLDGWQLKGCKKMNMYYHSNREVITIFQLLLNSKKGYYLLTYLLIGITSQV